eukprot:gb/GFBE01005672.1/.p1 GENE.gb/GFBE01005672.1/~~gb/GFBE01005672.1/.p1  ORF type:complete len:153 (+),score=12.54 gb/GFBE01005672.1/:1-459(+)
MAQLCRLLRASRHITPGTFRISRGFSVTRPSLPDDCSEEPTNCCGNNCDPCVWEVYHDKLKVYQASLRAWECQNAEHASSKINRAAGGAKFEPGCRAYLANIQAASLQHMNGLLVDILERDPSSRTNSERWRVRPVGGTRVLILPEEKLEMR